MKKDAFVIGVDYGTDSVRSILVHAANGEEISTSVFYYPRWRDGLFCRPEINQFRQHPLDYLEGLEATITDCLKKAGSRIAGEVKAISIDTTGSTPVATDATGTPLALLPGFENNPHAMFVLWKDHTAVKEAEEINTHAKNQQEDYLRFAGGIYSSEWFWAKLLHTLRADAQVRSAAYSWVEHCDWIPFLLTGDKSIDAMKRGTCSAGHKALWSEEFGGLPPDTFFSSLDPLLKGFVNRLYSKTYTADKPAGNLSAAWSEKLGLPVSVIIGTGAFDAHMGAVGGQIEPYHLSKVMGTSTCDMLVAPIGEVSGILVKGICGQVPGSIIPGMMGMEAGQSAFGDAYAWFRNILAWPLKFLGENSSTGMTDKQVQDLISAILPNLSAEAVLVETDEDSVLTVDWFNGRRTPDANQAIKGAITSLNLASNAPVIFRSVVEATCFGAKAIVDRFGEEGVPVKGLIGLGGVAKKSPFIMQMMADILQMPIRIHRSEQTCALGAAMFAATASGIYPRVEEAMQAMGQGFDALYQPAITNVDLYTKRYARYKALGRFVESQQSR